jgi:hypothetical protein
MDRAETTDINGGNTAFAVTISAGGASSGQGGTSIGGSGANGGRGGATGTGEASQNTSGVAAKKVSDFIDSVAVNNLADALQQGMSRTYIYELVDVLPNAAD